ncbi:hypothetical protein [Luteibacter sp. CQ10]|uniref:hypothetical protein n=1 Tax=Luteibacter sp. CQ10 TaxID=2805821 RepID=UPI0034A1D624
MASEEWKSVDNSYEAIGEPVYCAFLDILGYRNKMDEYYKGTLNLAGRISRAMKYVMDIKEIMDDANADRAGGRFRHLSDSIIITYPQTSSGLINLLHDTGVVAAHMAMDELFIRGGIAAGIHFDQDLKGVPMLVSSALRKAHSLEHAATTPRILIDPELSGKLTANHSRYVIREERDFVVHFLQRYASDPKAPRLLVKEIEDIAAYRDRYSSIPGMDEKMNYLIDYHAWMLGRLGGIDTAKLKGFNDRGFAPLQIPGDSIPSG